MILRGSKRLRGTRLAKAELLGCMLMNQLIRYAVGIALFCASIVSTPLCADQTPFGLIIAQQLRNSFTLVGSGARAAGMGNTFTAVADDATAASFNPAGLAQLVEPEASVVVDYLSLQDRHLNFLSLDQAPVLKLSDTKVDFRNTSFNFLSVTVPFKMASRQFSVQFSTQKVVDFSYRGDREFKEIDPVADVINILDQDSRQGGDIRVYSASLAAETTHRMLLGMTLNRWIGNWDFTSINAETFQNQPVKEYLTYSQQNALRGWNFDLGMLLRYKYLNVGLRYRTSFTADFNFDAQIDTNIETPFRPSPHTATKLQWPSTLSVGLALKPTDRLLIAADFGRTDWSKMTFALPDGGTRINFFDLLAKNKTLSTVSNDWHAGTEYLFLAGSAVIPVRAGWLREPQPGPDGLTGERIIATGFSAGGGIKVGWFAFDVAYQRKSSTTHISLFSEPDQIATGNLTSSSVGDLKRIDNRFHLSFIIQMPKSSGIRDLFHFIFVGPKTEEES